jgi:hypothetical protein
MAAGSFVSVSVLAYVVGDKTLELVTGMLGPLVAATASWVLTEEIYRRDPARLTGVLITAFVAKAVLFAAYVAVMLKILGLRPVPFVASFTGYFIALYLIEALLMRKLFSGGRAEDGSVEAGRYR